MPLLILACPCTACTSFFSSLFLLLIALYHSCLYFFSASFHDFCIALRRFSYICLSLIKLVISWLPLSLVESGLALPSQEGGILSVVVDQCNPLTRDKELYLHYLWRALAPSWEPCPGVLLSVWDPASHGSFSYQRKFVWLQAAENWCRWLKLDKHIYERMTISVLYGCILALGSWIPALNLHTTPHIVPHSPALSLFFHINIHWEWTGKVAMGTAGQSLPEGKQTKYCSWEQVVLCRRSSDTLSASSGLCVICRKQLDTSMNLSPACLTTALYDVFTEPSKLF